MSDMNPTISIVDNDTESSWVVLSLSDAGGAEGSIAKGGFVGNRKVLSLDSPLTIPNMKDDKAKRLFLQTGTGGYRIGLKSSGDDLEALIRGADGPAWTGPVELGATYELEVSAKGQPSLTKR